MSTRSCKFVAAPLAVATSIILLGCAGNPGPSSLPWRVEGIERITHGYQVAALGAFALGEAKRGEGRWQDAADAYAKAVVADPTMALGFEGLGLSEANLGQQQAAIAAFRRAVELRPGDLQFLNNLAYALIAAGQPGDSVPYLEAALQRDPHYERARSNLVRAQTAMAAMRGEGAVATAAPPSTARTDTAAASQLAPGVDATSVAPVSPVTPAPTLVSSIPATVTLPQAVAAPAAPLASLSPAPCPPIALAMPTAPATPQISMPTPVTPAPAPAAQSWVVTPVSVTAVAPAATAVPTAPEPAKPTTTSASPVPSALEPAKPIQTAALPSSASTSEAAPFHDRLRLDGVRVEVGNGNGVEGAAKRFADWLERHGAHVTRLFNVLPYATGNSRVMHPPGRDEAAATVVQAVPGHAAAAPAQDLHVDLRVVVGNDLAAASTCGGKWPCPELPPATAVASNSP